MLKIDDTLLLVIDVQGRLPHIVHENKKLITNIEKMIKGARVLGVPIIWTEYFRDKLGDTIEEVKNLLSDHKPIHKTSFSCCLNEEFMMKLKEINRKQIVIVGVEAHICVYQTTMDLLDQGYEVQLVADAVSSRSEENKGIGLGKMRDFGAQLTGTETCLFELLRRGDAEKAKEIFKIVQ